MCVFTGAQECGAVPLSVHIRHGENIVPALASQLGGGGAGGHGGSGGFPQGHSQGAQTGSQSCQLSSSSVLYKVQYLYFVFTLHCVVIIYFCFVLSFARHTPSVHKGKYNIQKSRCIRPRLLPVESYLALYILPIVIFRV